MKTNQSRARKLYASTTLYLTVLRDGRIDAVIGLPGEPVGSRFGVFYSWDEVFALLERVTVRRADRILVGAEV